MPYRTYTAPRSSSASRARSPTISGIPPSSREMSSMSNATSSLTESMWATTLMTSSVPSLRAMRSKLRGLRVKRSETSKPAVIMTLMTSWSWRSWDMWLQMDGACPYINIDMLIGIDDTDSPAGMCTTYLGAVLARRLIREHMRVREARLVRLNPNVTFKTRGNAAIMLDVNGDPERAFTISCALVEELADFSCKNTNTGVAVSEQKPDPAFYRKAVTDF